MIESHRWGVKSQKPDRIVYIFYGYLYVTLEKQAKQTDHCRNRAGVVMAGRGHRGTSGCWECSVAWSLRCLYRCVHFIETHLYSSYAFTVYVRFPLKCLPKNYSHSLHTGGPIAGGPIQ